LQANPGEQVLQKLAQRQGKGKVVHSLISKSRKKRRLKEEEK